VAQIEVQQADITNLEVDAIAAYIRALQKLPGAPG
jgi:hypothetical protein